MKLSYLLKGLPGHPLHPPLTDATIGVYTFATVAVLSDVLSITNHVGAQAWWIALIWGLITTALTATTGFIDWLSLEWGSELWKTATLHMIAMVSATVFFGLAAIFGHGSYTHANVSADMAFVVTVEDSGDFQETSVPVVLTIDAGGTPIKKQQTIPLIQPAQQQSVKFSGFNLPQTAFGNKATIEVEVKKVPGEVVLTNNSATYTAFFTLP